MELAIPLIAMGGLYIASKQRNDNDENVCDDENEEGFVDYKYLPNTNLANVNFPSEYPVKSPALDTTTKLAHDNRYDGSSYTDKYFGLNHPKDIHDPNRWSKNNSQNDENMTEEERLIQNEFLKTFLRRDQPTVAIKRNESIRKFKRGDSLERF